jgi:D-3-phosphoglycerate dehydrogenase / 2-oxoglutarate reductase
MPRVLISDKMSARAAEIFRDRGIDVDEKPGLEKDQLRQIIGDYDGLAVRSATKVSDKLLSLAPRLKVIGRAGIGVDNIDVKAATERGIIVMNTPFGNSITTAEHAIAMMMALARRIPAANQSTKKGLWEKSKFMGIEVAGKKLGVIGCGNIGAIVAERAQGLKMRVLGYDPYLSPERAQDLGIAKVGLDDLFARCDFITLHTPLTDGTRNIIDAAAIEKMKDGVRIINCARGGLVDEAALRDALESGKVAGAALDVFAEEPARQNPLFDFENVIATPHLGASTTEAQVNVAVQVANQMSDFLLSGGVANAINMPSITAEEAPKIKPYMELARQIGGFAGQMTTTDISSIAVEFEGYVAQLNTKPIMAVVLEGLLRSQMDSVNMVNAPVVAKERNIDISEIIHDRAGDYHTLIRICVKSKSDEISLTGTLFANQSPRIVSVRGMEVEAEISEHMLYVENADEPGFIGALGSMLGEEGINIATFHLGRAKGKHRAIALLSIDQPMPENVLERLAALSQVNRVRALHF